MVFAFLLIVTMDGADINTADMYFRDIHRCGFFARHLEEHANLTWSGNKVIHSKRMVAWCKPVMVSRETTFWD